MDDDPRDHLHDAIRLVAAGRVAEVTALLRGKLGTSSARKAPARDPAWPSPRAGSGKAASVVQSALRGLLDKAGLGELNLPGGFTTPPSRPPSAPVAEGAQFLTRSFVGQAGSRPYKLYIPSGYRGQAVPLIVMLHGCTQSPDDFAAGTRMNEIAQTETCLVAYPEQTSTANHSKCWNWFNTGDQRRDLGEPSLIAGMTREVMRDYAVDPQRVYVAGLSAGGAAAGIMGAAYPDLYAAIGVHSGLACGAAYDLPSALAAMREGGSGRAREHGSTSVRPAIVFHGDRDSTVNPRNGDEILAQLAQSMPLERRTEEGRAPGGHAYRRTCYVGSDGRAMFEHWIINGAGHAWSGGSAAGSFTDPRGPDATSEMLRFFMEHPHPRAGCPG
jgi:poly(hydroxyalkanoate) depolymerase family esterase